MCHCELRPQGFRLALEIGITGEAFAVEVEDFAAFLGGDAAVGDGLFGEVAEFRDEFLGVEFDVGEDVGDGIALDLVGVHGLSMKRSILPSQSQVISAMTARWRGFSSSRWMGMTGNNWSMAQESGSDWKSEKLP